MIYNAENPPTDIAEYTEELRRYLREERPSEIESPMGTHGVIYQGDEYAVIGFTLPDGVDAELEDGTYGPLSAYRISLQDGNA